MSELQGIRQSLTEDEKSGLKKTAKGTGIIAVFMIAIVAFIGWFSLSVLSGFMVWAMMVFLLFFTAITGFIVYARIKQAGSDEKIIYTGTVTEKKSETSQMRGSSLNETHTVRIDREWFTIEPHLFSMISQGEKVALHTVGNKQIFKVEVLEKFPGKTIQQTFVAPNHFSEPATHEEKSVLTKCLFRALLFRTLTGYFVFRIVYYLSVFLLVIVNQEPEGGHIAFGILAVRITLWIIYIWVNLKTIRLLIDRFTGNTYKETDQIVDKQTSNSKKPSPHSVVTTRNYSVYNPAYFYLKTTRYWLEISKDLYDSLETGEFVEIKRSKLAKVRLGIRKASKLNYR